MKILFLYTYNKGLLSDFFMDLAHQLTGENHEVKVFSLKSFPQTFFVRDIEIIVKRKGGYFSNYHQIYKTIKAVSPDVIISNFSYANPSLLAGRLLKIRKNIVWVHSLKRHGDPWRYQIFLKGLFYKLAYKVIVNSYILKKELKEVFKVSGSKIIAIPFWSNIEKIKSIPIKAEKGEGKILIGCPGRFTVIKNQIVLIEALPNLKNQIEDQIQVYFAGEGPNYLSLQRKVDELNLQEAVIFLGVLSAGQMRDFYKKMDVIVLPSLYESFGLVFIEALSLGTPVIVSTEFGALNFVDKDSEKLNSILFDPRDPDDLVYKLKNILVDENLENTFFKKMYSNYFDREVIYDNVKKLISD